MTESVALLAVTPATFWPGVQVKTHGTFAGNSVSLVVAVGVPSPILMLDAAVATSMIWFVWLPNAVDAALELVSATFCDAP